MDLRSTFGFHTTPFTREIRTEEMMSFPFLEEGIVRIINTLEKRMSAAIISPAGGMKSATLRQINARLSEARYRTRYVKVTSLSKRDMCREIAAACGIEAAGYFGSLVRKLQERFETDYATDGLRPVLILDEAHDLRPDVLSMLRVITNFKMDSQLVLSFVLAGQPGLRDLLARDDQEAVARRIVCYVNLRPLSRDEAHKYIAHRSAIAGASSCPFDEASVDAVYEISRGNARTIDNLALGALEAASAAKLKVVSVQHILEAKRNLWP
jgi:general secretion pathway protein A